MKTITETNVSLRRAMKGRTGEPDEASARRLHESVVANAIEIY